MLLIFINKQALSSKGCRIPFFLAFLHMATGAVLARFAMRLQYSLHSDVVLTSQSQVAKEMSDAGTLRGWLASEYNAIAALLAGALVCANGAYMFLSVPLIQMLKAGAPAVTYFAGIGIGAEVFSGQQMTNVLIICGGVFMSVYAASDFNGIGVAFQILAITCDSLRCTLLQRAVSRSGAQMNPIAALAEFAPRAAAMLAIPTLYLEAPALLAAHECLAQSWRLLFASCIVAFGLNVAVCTLIGATSALTTSISGILKDIICIAIAIRLHNVPVAAQQWIGYVITLWGIGWHHYRTIFNKNYDQNTCKVVHAILPKSTVHEAPVTPAS